MIRSLELPQAIAWEGTDARGLVWQWTGRSHCVTVCWLASTSLDHLQYLVIVYLIQMSFTCVLVGNYYQAFCSNGNQRLLLIVVVTFFGYFSRNCKNRRLACLWLSVDMNSSYFYRTYLFFLISLFIFLT